MRCDDDPHAAHRAFLEPVVQILFIFIQLALKESSVIPTLCCFIFVKHADQLGNRQDFGYQRLSDQTNWLCESKSEISGWYRHLPRQCLIETFLESAVFKAGCSGPLHKFTQGFSLKCPAVVLLHFSTMRTVPSVKLLHRVCTLVSLHQYGCMKSILRIIHAQTHPLCHHRRHPSSS